VDDDELARALAQAVDEDGNDLRQAEAMARMTPEERAVSEVNVSAWVERARRDLRSHRDDPTGV